MVHGPELGIESHNDLKINNIGGVACVLSSRSLSRCGRYRVSSITFSGTCRGMLRLIVSSFSNVV